MKRPTRLNSIKNMSSLILKYSQKNRISMELLFDEFKREIIQFGKIGMFVLDEAYCLNIRCHLQYKSSSRDKLQEYL